MKTILYSDRYGNTIDLGTMEGIEIVLNDIFSAAEKASSCSTIKENIKAATEKCCKNRVKELE